LKLLALPREVGPHPETGEMVLAGLGRFGPYLKHGKVYKNIAQEELLTIGLNRAVALLAEARAPRARGKPEPLRVLGSHPATGDPVQVFSGRYGPYVSHAKVYATLPKDVKPEEVTLETALQLLAAREAKAPAKGAAKRKRAAKSAPTAPAAKGAAKDAAKAKPPRKTGGKRAASG
jgi:DNA topoisomerase-1